jgi:uncharacterized protein (DUF1499 family)
LTGFPGGQLPAEFLPRNAVQRHHEKTRIMTIDQLHQTMSNNQPAGGRSIPVIAQAGLALSLLACIVIVLAGFGVRIRLWNFGTGFEILKYGAWCGAAAFAVSLAGAFLSVRNRRMAAALLSIVGVLIGFAAFGKPLLWKMTAYHAPPIHDITTDIVNPPQFVAVVPLRAGAPNPVEYGGAEIAVRQREAYPDIKTLIVNSSPERAFQQALEAVRAMGWNIVATVPGEGRIEATDSTFWFGFKDDIVIRITPAGYRSMLDIRSVSRVGTGDAGANANRIRAFMKALAKKS